MGIKTLIRNVRALASRSLENPSVSLNDPDSWNEFYGGGLSASGKHVNAKTSLSVASVWQAVTMISGDLARLPLIPYNISGDSDVPDRKHVAYKIVRRKANDERVAFQVWRDFWFQYLIWNRAFLWIDRDGAGRPIGLINLLPDRTAPARVSGRLYYESEIGGKLTRFDPSEIFHVQGPAVDWFDPPELLKMARDSWGLAIAAQDFESKFFNNGVRAGGYLIIPPHWTETAAQNLEEGLRKKSGSENFFQTVVFRDGAKFEKASFNAQEMEMSKVREEQVREVARWFNLAPSRLGLSDSTSYNSKSEDNRAYLDSTLAPHLAAQEAEADDKLLSERQKERDSHEFRHDTSDLLRMSQRERYQNHAIGIRARFLLPNEARRVEGLPPVEGGDEFAPMPGAANPEKNNPAGGDEDTGEGGGGADNAPKNPGNTPAEPDEEGQNSTNSDESRQETTRVDDPLKIERNRILYSLTTRARHKAERGGNAFVEFIDGGLPSFRREAGEIGDESLVLEFHKRALDLISSVSEDNLTSGVETLCSEFEREKNVSTTN